MMTSPSPKREIPNRPVSTPVNTPVNTIEWSNGAVSLIDQTRLPSAEVVLEVRDYRQLIEAIESLRVRGAPALGVAAAYGIALGAQSLDVADAADFLARLDGIAREIVAARPTAVNMAWAADRMMALARRGDDVAQIKTALVAEAQRIQEEDVEINRRLGAHGADLIADGATVLTHCNAGSLATAGFGTALGVLRSVKAQGKSIKVMATETRPLLQGARLTAWELQRDGFDTTLITDSMAGHFLSTGAIDSVIVGADRIAMNGDVANKIGTYTIAVVARENDVPFHVAAPISTVDPALETGAAIPIEERSPNEVLHWGGVATAPEGVKAANPAFDVTPNRFVSAIITERGVARAPYTESLKLLVERG
jgi:methylthioribose-1-phosphate isomerase